MIQSIAVTRVRHVTAQPRGLPRTYVETKPVHPSNRRRRLLSRGLPALAGLAALAVLVVALLSSLGDSEAERTAERFSRAWERGDYTAMHALLTDDAKAAHPLGPFRRSYDQARRTATATAFAAGKPREDGGGARVAMTVRTVAFGTVRRPLALPIEDGRVKWAPHLTFPGVPPGARLERRTRAPRRARILARGGRPIVTGPADSRNSPLGPAGGEIAGTVAPAKTRSEREQVVARGFPPEAPVGTSGLERILERRVAGTPGGTLTAGAVTLADTAPRRARAVRTTIDVDAQRAAAASLAGRLGGVAALEPRTGEVRALAGIAFSAPQPPGSVFKLITAGAALEARLVRPSSRFPVRTEALIDGFPLQNANGESCGGTFVNSFAHSCNSVFAPLGIRVGARRLVRMAQRFGFNEPPALPGAQPSTIPPAAEIGSRLALGATAIGQGKVLATPLQLASMAQTIAAGGIRHRPTLLPVSRPEGQRVLSARVARQMRRLMVAVVRFGTGTSAAIPGVTVAGKTGTAELEQTVGKPPAEEGEPATADTDAWFTAFAPARRPKLAVAVLLVRAGAGGDTAAPAARIVLESSVR